MSSGVIRNVLADITKQGDTPAARIAAYQAAMSPESIRAETGSAEEAKRESKK